MEEAGFRGTQLDDESCEGLVLARSSAKTKILANMKETPSALAPGVLSTRGEVSVPTFGSLDFDASVFPFRTAESSARSTPAWLAEILAVAFGYYVVGNLSLTIAVPPGVASAFWPAAGFALVMLMLRGSELWPGIFLGSLAVNLPALFRMSPTPPLWLIAVVGITIALGSSLQAVMGKRAVSWTMDAGRLFESTLGSLKFALATAACCLIASTTGALVLSLSGLVPWSQTPFSWLTWLAGDFIGILVVVPFLFSSAHLTWRTIAQLSRSPRRLVEGFITLAFFLGLTWIVFSHDFGPGLITTLSVVSIGSLIWGAFRFSQFAVATYLLCLAIISVRGTAMGLGPFAWPAFSPHYSLVLLQSFLGAEAILMFTLVGALQERDTATRQLKKLKFMIDHGNEAHLLADESGRIIWVNPVGCAWLGYREEELLTRNLSSVCADPAVWRTSSPAETSPTSAPHETQLRHKEGSLVPVEATVSNFNLDGNLRVLMVARDISERLRARRELERYATELERSNRNLSEFASVASHDLKSPLRSMTYQLQLLQKEFGDKLEQNGAGYLVAAVDGAKRLAQLVDSILEYSRVGVAAERKEVNLTSCLQNALADLKPLIEETSTQVTASELPVVRANPLQMEVVFRNLISNAIKYRGRLAPRIDISVSDRGQEWLVSISDNGIGIEPQHQDSIFEMFRRLHAHDSIPGSGVGLASCRRIIEYHGGKIGVTSTPGLGATFFFSLPKHSA